MMPSWLHKYCTGMPAETPEEASRMLRKYSHDCLKDGVARQDIEVRDRRLRLA